MIRGQQFLNVARELESREGEEWNRTCISRLYYGVYLEYRQYCEENLGFQRERMAREHQVVYNLIAQQSFSIAEDLRDLRNARNQADYDLGLPEHDIADRLVDAVRLANRLMTYLTSIRTSS